MQGPLPHVAGAIFPAHGTAKWVRGLWLGGVAMLLVLGGCATHPPEKPLTLKAGFAKEFPMGVAVNLRQFSGQDSNGVAIIVSQYNSVSPENALKWESVHPNPGPDGYDFTEADAYVAFGEKHHMLIVGHTLAWHGQTPRWVFQDDHGRTLQATNAADRALLLQRLLCSPVRLRRPPSQSYKGVPVRIGPCGQPCTRSRHRTI